MTLYEMIKQLKNDARKTRSTDDITFYSTIQGELERVEKETSDEKALKVLGKILQSNQEAMQVHPSGQLVWENVLLSNLIEQFTPTQMTEDDIDLTIRMITKNNPSYGIREIMSYFKENHAGHYDPKVVSSRANL